MSSGIKIHPAWKTAPYPAWETAPDPTKDMTIKIGRARLKNKSKLPTDEMVKLTQFVLNFLECRRKVKITVLNARVERGIECKKRIKIWLPKGGWPRSGNTGTQKNFPHYLMRDWKEGYVVLLAHEVSHALGADGSANGEWACETNACAALLTYRSL